MGNRCVLVHKSVTPKNQGEHLGIYVHWYGDYDTMQGYLDKARGVIRPYSQDPDFCMARLCQHIANEISRGKVEETGIGIGIVKYLDTWNRDNGTLFFDDDFNIVKQTSGKEFKEG